MTTNRPFYELTREDVGQPNIFAFGRSWPVQSFGIGHVMEADVGKRCYQISPGVIQVENDDRRRVRLAKAED